MTDLDVVQEVLIISNYGVEIRESLYMVIFRPFTPLNGVPKSLISPIKPHFNPNYDI